MNVDMMGTKGGLDPKLIPPRGAQATGRVFPQPNGEDRIIYQQRVFDLEATLKTRRPRKNPDGSTMVRKNNNTGEVLLTVMRVDPQYRVREFILRGFGNGKVKAIENFDLTPEQKAERARREARDRWMDEFRDLALQEGVSPADIVKQFVASKAGEGEEIEVDDEQAAQIAQSLQDDLGGDEGVMARPELPFAVTEMSVRDIKDALRGMDLTDAEKALLREAEQGGEGRTTVLQLLI